jgi:hypothetical protein
MTGFLVILPFGDNHSRSSTVSGNVLSSLDSHVYFLLDLLRVIRKGPVVKAAVDDAIDQCAEVFNLRDSIEEARIRAEQATDEREKRMFAQKGLLRPYLHANVSLIPLSRPPESTTVL